MAHPIRNDFKSTLMRTKIKPFSLSPAKTDNYIFKRKTKPYIKYKKKAELMKMLTGEKKKIFFN